MKSQTRKALRNFNHKIPVTSSTKYVCTVMSYGVKKLRFRDNQRWAPIMLVPKRGLEIRHSHARKPVLRPIDKQQNLKGHKFVN